MKIMSMIEQVWAFSFRFETSEVFCLFQYLSFTCGINLLIRAFIIWFQFEKILQTFRKLMCCVIDHTPTLFSFSFVYGL
jgi:hypothetical protein